MGDPRLAIARLDRASGVPLDSLAYRFDIVLPIVFGAALYAAGAVLEAAAPALGTSGPQLFVWGFCISTVVLYHATFTINSLAHRWGRRRYATHDDSRNNGWLALLTFGEGWHNNHHAHPVSARHGLAWYEFDLSWITLNIMRALGIASNIQVARLPQTEEERKAA